jgi:hypothetical protein
VQLGNSLRKKNGFSDTFCRWTAWLSIDHGGYSDKEDLAGLVSAYGPYACAKPLQIKVRSVGAKEPATARGGPQVSPFA